MPAPRSLLFVVLAPPLLLGACGSGGDQTAADGRMAQADTANGRVALDIPGFKGEIRLPPLAMAGRAMEIDGVRLFPGSSIDGMAVMAGRSGEEDVMTLRFIAPAGAGAVKAYYLAAFRKKGIATRVDQNGRIAGTTKDGAAFTLAIANKGDRASEGTLVIHQRDGG